MKCNKYTKRTKKFKILYEFQRVKDLSNVSLIFTNKKKKILIEILKKTNKRTGERFTLTEF